MQTESPVKLKLDEDTRRDVELTICARIRSAVSSSEDRDSDIAEWNAQLEGLTQVSGHLPWRDACMLDDPITRENHTSLLASSRAALSKDQKWWVRATNPDDDDIAQLLQQLLKNAAQQFDFNRSLYDLLYNTLRHPAGVLFIGWKQETKRVRGVEYLQKGSNLPISQFEREDGVEYEARGTVQEVDAYDGIEFRVPDLSDIYVYPSTAPSLDSAMLVMERRWLSEDDLYDGIDTYGYDEDSVQELCTMGGTEETESGTDIRREDAERAGISGENVDNRDGYYECFLVYGRLPRLRDVNGDNRIDDELAHDEMMYMVCPKHDIVFYMDYAPDAERPYCTFNILGKPNRLYGACVPSMLEVLQAEANANIRHMIDGYNLESSPVIVAPRKVAGEFGKYKIYPGAVLPEDVKDEIHVLQWTRQSLDGLGIQQDIRNRASSQISSASYGQYQPKVRKQAEIENVMGAAAAKFDLYLQNFQMSGMVDAGYKILALLIQYQTDAEIPISPHDLRKRFQIIPAATSQMADEQAQLAISQKIIEYQAQYLQAVMTFEQVKPDFIPLVYHAFHKALLDLGEHNPETYLGPLPEPPQPAVTPPMGIPAQGAPTEQTGMPPNGFQQILNINPGAMVNGNGLAGVGGAAPMG